MARCDDCGPEAAPAGSSHQAHQGVRGMVEGRFCGVVVSVGGGRVLVEGGWFVFCFALFFFFVFFLGWGGTVMKNNKCLLF